MKKIYLTFFITLSFLPGYSQKNLYQHTGESFILSQPLENFHSYEYTAGKFIKMEGEQSKSGFQYSPDPGQHFQAKMDPLMLFPPVEGEFGGPNPEDNGVVGSIPGYLNVSPSGKAVYTIPIELPPGINGMTPKVNLIYSSTIRNGLLGIGWDISGLSSITRTGTDFYHEGEIDGVDFDENDKLILDGNRLIPVNNGAEFRTEIEQFSKITPHGNVNGFPQWFLAYTKDGLIIQYGVSEDSRIQAPGLTDILSWQINRVYDRKGNSIDFTYIEEGGLAKISEIKYAIVGFADPLYVINFNYIDERPDPIKQFLYGCLLQSDDLLSSIEIKYDGTTIKTYELEYNFEDLYSKLTMLTLWDQGKTSSFNPSKFSWGEINEIPVEFDVTDITDLNDSDIVTGDYNGDGKTDIAVAFYYLDGNVKVFTDWAVYYSIGTEGTSFQKVEIDDLPGNEFKHFSTIDFNGDGLDDIVEVCNTYFYFYVSTGNDFNSSLFGGSCNNVENHCEFSPADFNGNGINELLLLSKNYENAQYHYHINLYEYNGTLFVSLLEDETLLIDGYHYYSQNENLETLQGDFNGDGKTDLLIEKDNLCTVYGLDTENNTLMIVYNPNFNLPINNIGDNRYVGDINVDGISDLITVNNYTPLVFSIRLFNGHSAVDLLNTAVSFPMTNAHEIYDDYQNYIFSDFNGDGKTDILLNYSYFTVDHPSEPPIFQGFYWDVYYSTGTNFIEESWFQQGPFLFNPFVFDRRYPFCDFNGDGKKDGFIYTFEPSNYKWIAFFHKDEHSLLINKITDGLGKEIELEYEPLTNESIYTKDTEIQEKIKNIQTSEQVVSKIGIDDGMGGKFTLSYKYEGAKLHFEGKGFLGFKKLSMENSSSGINKISESAIHNTYFFPYLTSQKSYIGEELISESFFENEVIEFGNYRIFSFNDIELHKTYSTGDPGSSYVKTVRIEKNIAEVDEDYGNISHYNIFTDEQEFDLIEPSSSYDFYTLNDFSYNYNEIDNWLVSRISSKSLTKKNPEDDNEYHEIYNYSYYPLNDPLQQFPLLQTETYIPNNANEYHVNTIYQYDNFGNITHKTIEVPNYSVKPVETRSIEFEYSADYNYRFPTKTIMEINEITTFEETMTYYPNTGLLNNHVDINGLTTYYNYDSFGRVNEIISPNGNKTVNVLRWSQYHVDNPINGLYFLWSQTSGLKEVLTFFDNNGRTLKNVGYGLDENSKIFTDFEYL